MLKIDLQKKIIPNEDVFTLLKSRYPFPFLDSTPKPKIRHYNLNYQNPIQFSSLEKKLLGQLVKEHDQKLLWKTNHLPQDTQHYLQMAHLVYLERSEDNPALATQLETIIQIEIFMECLKHSPRSAFDLPLEPAGSSYTIKEFENSITRVGKQFLFLYKKIYLDTHVTWLINNQNSLSSNIKSFFLHNSNIKRFVKIHLLADSVNFVDLAKVLNKRIQHIYLRSYNTFRDLEQENSVKQSSALKSLSFNKRVTQAITYVKPFFKTDSVLYRMQFKAEKVDTRMAQAEMAILLTKFIHIAKRARPLSFMKGYIGRWEEDAEQNPFVDIIFILDANHQNTALSFDEEMNQRWNKFLKSAAEKTTCKAIDEERIVGTAELIPLINSVSELNSMVCHIETMHKAKQIAFIKTVIPYFAYKDLFEPELMDKPAKRFFRGTLPGKKRVRKQSDSEIPAE